MALILLVDDDPEFVEATAALLESKGHTIAKAATGENGCSVAKCVLPDLILLDVMMQTDNDGIDAARRLREDPVTRKIPVVLITGARTARGLPFGFEPDSEWLPVKAVLEKPVRPEDLLAKVAEALLV